MDGAKHVSIEYRVFLEDGTEVETNVGKEPLSLDLGSHLLLPAIEEVVGQMKIGEEREVTLLPENAFGPILDEAFREVDANAIPEQLRFEGAVLGVQDETGEEWRIRIHELREGKAIIDFNHPLAGQTLKFWVHLVQAE